MTVQTVLSNRNNTNQGISLKSKLDRLGHTPPPVVERLMPLMNDAAKAAKLPLKGKTPLDNAAQLIAEACIAYGCTKLPHGWADAAFRVLLENGVDSPVPSTLRNVRSGLLHRKAWLQRQSSIPAARMAAFNELPLRLKD